MINAKDYMALTRLELYDLLHARAVLKLSLMNLHPGGLSQDKIRRKANILAIQNVNLMFTNKHLLKDY